MIVEFDPATGKTTIWDGDDIEEVDGKHVESLFHDEGTLDLVREALRSALGKPKHDARAGDYWILYDRAVDDYLLFCISAMQNAGIKFREVRREPSPEGEGDVPSL